MCKVMEALYLHYGASTHSKGTSRIGYRLALVAATVADVHECFRDARVREFVPLMVERRAHAKLAAIAV